MEHKLREIIARPLLLPYMSLNIPTLKKRTLLRFITRGIATCKHGVESRDFFTPIFAQNG